MRLMLFCVLLMAGCSDAVPSLVQAGQVALSPPLIDAPESLLSPNTVASARHVQRAATLACAYLRTDSTSRPVGTFPFMPKADGCLSCTASHPDFLESDSREVQFRLPSSCRFEVNSSSTLPSLQYVGGGLSSLSDGVLASSDIHQTWLGYDLPIVDLHLHLPEDARVSHLALSTLVQHGSWIFEPARLELLADGKPIAFQDVKVLTPHITNRYFFDLHFDQEHYSDLTLRIHSCNALPSWHAGAGLQGWLFLDEIILN